MITIAELMKYLTDLPDDIECVEFHEGWMESVENDAPRYSLWVGEYGRNDNE